MERGMTKYASIAAVMVLTALGLWQLLKPRKPRSFRKDPLGALKDHSEIIADKAHDTIDALKDQSSAAASKAQDTLDSLKDQSSVAASKAQDTFSALKDQSSAAASKAQDTLDSLKDQSSAAASKAQDTFSSLKEQGSALASKAQDTTEDLLSRIQESLNEVRSQLPDVDARDIKRKRKQLEKQLHTLNKQAAALAKNTRKTGLFSR